LSLSLVIGHQLSEDIRLWLHEDAAPIIF